MVTASLAGGAAAPAVRYEITIVGVGPLGDYSEDVELTLNASLGARFANIKDLRGEASASREPTYEVASHEYPDQRPNDLFQLSETPIHEFDMTKWDPAFGALRNQIAGFAVRVLTPSDDNIFGNVEFNATNQPKYFPNYYVQGKVIRTVSAEVVRGATEPPVRTLAIHVNKFFTPYEDGSATLNIDSTTDISKIIEGYVQKPPKLVRDGVDVWANAMTYLAGVGP